MSAAPQQLRAAPAAGPREQEAPVASRPVGVLEPHPQAGLVPPLPADQYRAFRADITARGVLCPLEITSENVVLDGRERLRAARELGLERLPVRLVAPADEREHIILAALQRRQLSASQRAALAVVLDRYRELRSDAEARRLGNLRQSAEVASLPPRGKSRELAASWAGVSPRTLQDAATVQAHDPQLFEQVKAGRLAANTAARRVRRRLRDHNLAAPALPQGPFELIYADPPWQLGNPDSQHAPENHYPTMPLDQLASLKIPAAEDALLLLWAVNCLLPEALQVVDAWGFSYKTNLVWVKDSIGLGNWARNRHELLLLATRGRFPLADPADRPHSVLEAPRRAHSQKPDQVYELIERAWPQASKLELFARSARQGWAAWGNQIAPDANQLP